MSTFDVTTLPTAEVCARVAIAAAGLSGNRHIGHAIHRRGTATDLVADCYDHRSDLSPELVHRLRRLGAPGIVSRILTLTTHMGTRILTPADDLWPQQLNALGAAAPACLWVAGDPLLLEEPPVVVTGTTAPDPWLRHDVVDLVTRIADDGWTVATAARPGVDHLTHKATLAMSGRLITVATTARASRHELEVVVSENPPMLPVILASALRTPILLAALGGKVLVAGGVPGSGAHRTGVAAHALARPLGVVGEGSGRAGATGLRVALGARLVGTLAEVERLV
jgi:DNA processing protein